MVRVIMHGCNGRMGRVITELIAADSQVEIVAGIDTFTGISNTYPVYETISQCQETADVVIDFSNAAAIDGLLEYCEAKNLPVLLCSTGLSPSSEKRNK